MRQDHQATIFELIKHKLDGNDSLGHVLSEVLSISQDAVYRRFRGETLFTIYELEKLCLHFDISMDALFQVNKNKVIFEFKPIKEYDFSMDLFLRSLRDPLRKLKEQKNPRLIISVNNTPILQLLNYPHLVRFKLFFWAKNYLKIKEFEGKKFKYEKISPESFSIGIEALKIYNTIPSREIIDPELLRGFIREIYYYFESQQFEDPEYAVYLLDLTERFVDHYKAQIDLGKKFVSTTEAPASGNDFEVYHNETINANTTIHYQTDDYQGLFIGHNLLNSLHTYDDAYIEDSLEVLHKQMANSSIISVTNEKERNVFFNKLKTLIEITRKKIQTEIEETRI